MFKKHASLFVSLAAGLILVFALNQSALAMGGYAGSQVIRGLIENIDYQTHSITVNGQTYPVAPSAKFSGIAGFSVLSVGMPIQIMLGETATSSGPGPTHGPKQEPVPATAANTQSDTQPHVIVGITWLPGGIH